MCYGKMDGRHYRKGCGLSSGALFLSIGLLCGSAQHGLAGETPGGTFAGKLEEGREITLKAWKHYTSPIVDGFELEGASKKVILLSGEQQNDGEWLLTEFPDPERAAGTLRGRPGMRGFTGTWRSHGGGPAVPIQLRRVDEATGLAVEKEIDQESVAFAERAFQGAVAGQSQQTLYYLRLYRVTNGHRPYTDYWEALFDAKSRGVGDTFYKRARSLTARHGDFTVLQAPLAYLLAERGEIADAKRIYQSQCRTHPYSQSALAFTCLMAASLSEKTGDVIGMWEGYDFACDELPFACRKAFGLAEELLIGAVERRDSAAALKQLQQPGLNVNARHGKALLSAVSGGGKDLVKELLAYGANPNADGSIMSNAISGSDPDIPWLLLDHGVDPNFLFDAVERGNLSLAEALIRKGARINDNGYVSVGTALMAAAEDNNREMVKLLLQNGADPTITAKFHDPPLRSTTDPEIKRMLRIALDECKAGTHRCAEKP
jgi:hypothetical protein